MLMLVRIVTIYQDVVQIHQNELVNVPLKNLVHKTLKRAWSVAKS